MSVEWVVDKRGTGMWLRKTSKGRYTGLSFKTDAVENMSKVKLRSDDVMLCSYTKCGIHWLWENVRMLISGEVKLDNLEKESSMMEYQSNLDDLPSPRILNNHGYFDEQPADLLRGKNKLVLLYRNPKDVAVSSHQHHTKFPKLGYNEDLDNFLQRFLDGQVLNGSYFEYLQSFEDGLNKNRDIPFLLVRYEDLHQSPLAERRRIAQFLGKTYEDNFLREVWEATHIDVMRKTKNSSMHGNDPDVKSVMYRKGKVGGWMNTMNTAQSQVMDDAVHDVMACSDMFSFVYSID